MLPSQYLGAFIRYLIAEDHLRGVPVGDDPGMLEDVDDVAHEGDVHVLEVILVQVQQHAHFYPKSRQQVNHAMQ